ncbi:MAG TPA: hypothetical protein DHU96_16130, partial [Actinobacteria bacterium]|nr:hypothetical protein [Actinomycetota bacterium]
GAGDGGAPERVAAGFLEIAVANMANAIKKISVQRGYDVTQYVLATFGGAGGQHACAVADALGITSVFIHPLAGVLSAYGMGLADVTAMREAAVEAPLAADLLPELDKVITGLEADARAELAREEIEPGRIHAVRRAHLRYEGTDTALPVPLAGVADMVAGFEQAYRQHFSFLMRGKPIIVEAVSVELAAASAPLATQPLADMAGAGPGGGTSAQPGREQVTDQVPGQEQARGASVSMYVSGGWADVPLARRRDLPPGRQVAGPALIVEDFATTVIEPGWRAEVTGRGDLLLTRVSARPERRAAGTAVDPVMLEIFNNLFMSVAEQMGVRLRATAHSVNIKERLDFSCAIFDAVGGLIANAPHIPVHLGSMGESIKIIARRNAGRMCPGDVYVLNDPYHGGTHLPDITVVTPVFGEAGREILFYVASRGHHAEIGGITPGSMPAFSTRVEEEGVLIDNWLLVRDGELRESETLNLLRSAEFPSRNPEVNLADLRAQIAANSKGVQELRKMTDHFGLDVVQAYMEHVQDNAEEAVRRVIGALRDGQCAYELDNGAVIKVAVRVDKSARSAEIDFTGTSPQLPGNFNAPSSVAMAAVLYVLRTLVADEIPLNSGCLKPVKVIIPAGCMLAPQYPAAVAAGNVETSQAITGALYAALGVMAEGSGTMNNVTIGNQRHQYYETVASGSGAGNGFAGTDVVQTHMTNSRLTDPEVLEWRYPVRLERYAIRRGSGGAGHWRGGDGGRREIRFGEPMTVTTLASHRRIAPYGMAGGSPGALGRHWVQRADGSVTPMAGCDSVEAGAGDVFVLGATSWRIEDITADQVLVSPAPGQPGRLPFWHGDAPGRPAELGKALGAFCRELGAADEQAAATRLRSAGLDELAAGNLIRYLGAQREATGYLPDDRTLVMERFRDELGDWRLVLHSPYGSRVHAPWALAIAARLRERYQGMDVQALHTDDGIVLRVPDAGEPPPAGIAEFDADEIDPLVTAELGGSALFAARFRECAARALLLPRRQPGRRSPLWQQRQRSAQLLAVAARYGTFPIVLETVRECVQDVFDVPALTALMRDLASRKVRLVDVETPTASPFGRSLLFRYVGMFMYEGDSPLAERRAQALALDSSLLAELLGQADLRELLDPAVVEQTEAELQRLAAGRACRDLEGAADLLRTIGPLSAAEVADRCAEPGAAPGWLAELSAGRRVIEVRISGEARWAAIEDAGRLRDALGVPLPVGLPAAFTEPGPDRLGDLVARYAHCHGPFTAAEVASRYGLGTAVVTGALRRLAA